MVDENGICSSACHNPACPYLTQINESTQVTKQTKLALIALLGEELTGLNSGIIRTILSKLDKVGDEQKVQRSWMSILRPITIGVLSFAGSGLVFYLITHAYGAAAIL
jgi:hypothetical protein